MESCFSSRHSRVFSCMLGVERKCTTAWWRLRILNCFCHWLLRVDRASALTVSWDIMPWPLFRYHSIKVPDEYKKLGQLVQGVSSSIRWWQCDTEALISMPHQMPHDSTCCDIIPMVCCAVISWWCYHTLYWPLWCYVPYTILAIMMLPYTILAIRYAIRSM